VDWVGEKLGVRQLDDWYKIRVADIRALSAGSFIEHYYNNRLLFIRFTKSLTLGKHCKGSGGNLS
jgi:hypothetical protein